MALHELTVWPVWRLQFFRLTCGCGRSLVCSLLVSLGGDGMSEVLLERVELSADLDPQLWSLGPSTDHNKHRMELLRNVNKAHSNKINNTTDWDCLLKTHIPQLYPSTNTNHL
jgi:hypothetical protein